MPINTSFMDIFKHFILRLICCEMLNFNQFSLFDVKTAKRSENTHNNTESEQEAETTVQHANNHKVSSVY